MARRATRDDDGRETIGHDVVAAQALYGGSGAGLYIHIPFCARKCAYCDFVSRRACPGDILAYVDALSREMERVAPLWDGISFRTAFVGGGTPTLLSGEQIARVFDAARARFDLSGLTEATLEGNPGALSTRAFEGYLRAGVNRFSFGAQASQPHLLERLSRIHTWAQVVETVRAARAAGARNVSIDLMYALPEQTRGDWRDTLARAVDLGLEHVSCYALIPEAGTPLGDAVLRGDIDVPGEDDELGMLDDARAMLGGAGFERYEVSNYAQPGRRCAHNLIYWRNGEYAGLGVAAHGRRGRERLANGEDIDAYLRGEDVQTREMLNETDDRFETVMLALRLVEGLDLAAFERRFGASALDVYADAVRTGVAAGRLVVEDGHLRATAHGMNVLNAVLVAFLEG